HPTRDIVQEWRADGCFDRLDGAHGPRDAYRDLHDPAEASRALFIQVRQRANALHATIDLAGRRPPCRSSSPLSRIARLHSTAGRLRQSGLWPDRAGHDGGYHGSPDDAPDRSEAANVRAVA